MSKRRKQHPKPPAPIAFLIVLALLFSAALRSEMKLASHFAASNVIQRA
jgi:hypothetical protein